MSSKKSKTSKKQSEKKQPEKKQLKKATCKVYADLKLTNPIISYLRSVSDLDRKTKKGKPTFKVGPEILKINTSNMKNWVVNMNTVTGKELSARIDFLGDNPNFEKGFIQKTIKDYRDSLKTWLLENVNNGNLNRNTVSHYMGYMTESQTVEILVDKIGKFDNQQLKDLTSDLSKDQKTKVKEAFSKINPF